MKGLLRGEELADERALWLTASTGEIVKFLSAGLLRAFSMLMSIETL